MLTHRLREADGQIREMRRSVMAGAALEGGASAGNLRRDPNRAR